ncbi:DUF5333 domain-containing protein [Cognatishimia sp. MH4019]|uniref:DUF5333 domain-containing protein n=1 Tax=Cognatishimia sp. MH4019 TaxID=2854030 RepID=UPI001CD1CD8D|nr:DUF5333 domain-containing protein [Cognatishimia sp. MH4019]
MKTLLSAMLLGVMATSAAALTPLPEEKHINDQLLAASVGDKIRKNCPSISARMFVVWQKANDLEDYARDKGYSEEEVKAFLKDKDERKRMKRLRNAYLEENGVSKDNPDSYCALGEKEIKAKSLIGELLRAN